MKKRLFITTIILVLTFSFTACGGSKENKSDSNVTTKEDISTTGVAEQTSEETSEEESKKEEEKSISVEELMNYPETPEEDFDTSTDADGTVNIWGYEGTDSVVVIPKEIQGSTKIKIKRFYCEHNLSAIRIPGNAEIAYSDSGVFIFGTFETAVIEEGVKKLTDYCFSSSNLRTIILPNSLESIGATVFAGTHLSEIIIPDNVTLIDQYLFQEMESDNLVINLPDNITEIDYGAFDDNAGKTFTFKVKEGTTTYNTLSAYIEENKDRDDLPEFVIEEK